MKQVLLYSLVGLSLSSISFVAQAKDHRSPQVSTNPLFHHYSDFIDIANEDIEDYINHQYTTPTTGVPEYVFNHVGKESGDGSGVNHQGASGRYNEMFDAELEFNNVVKRDNTIGDQVMSKYRDSRDMLWLKVRHMERYNAERERLYSEYRKENGWKAMSGGSGVPKTVHLDVYGARVGNYRAEQLAKYRLKQGNGPVGTTSPHQDDYKRMGGAINWDHMNTLEWTAENFVSPTWSYHNLLPHGNVKNVQTQTPLDEQAHGHTADIVALEKYMFNDGEVDGSHDISWGRGAYSSYMYERVELGKDKDGHIDMATTIRSPHLAKGLPSPYLSDGSSNPDWHPIGHFVSIMSDENINAPGSVVTSDNYASVDEFGFKRTDFIPPTGLKTFNGKQYFQVIVKSDDPTLVFMSADTVKVNGKKTQVLDENGKVVYDAVTAKGYSADSLYDKQNKEYKFYVPVDMTKDKATIYIFLYPANGGSGVGFQGDQNLGGVDPDELPHYPDHGVKEGSVGEKKTGDDFRVKTTRALFTTPGDVQNALLGGPFLQKQAIANYQNIEVDGAGKIALDDPKTVIEYGYGKPENKESLSKNNVAYLSNRGIVMATNGAKAVKLNDTDIFVNEGVLYADGKSIAIEMNAHDNIIQLRNDLVEGVIDGGAGQDTLLLSKPKHNMDEVGSDKSALDSDKYVINNITLNNIEQIHAQSGDWYFKNSTINLGGSNLSKATTLPWAINDASGLTDTYDYIPQSGNVTFLGNVNIDATKNNSLIYAKNITFKGSVTLKNLSSTTNKINLSHLFNATDELSMNADNIKIDGVTTKDAKLVVGQYDRPITGSVLLGTSKSIVMVDKGEVLPVDATLISKLQATDKKNIGLDKVGEIADSELKTVTEEINAIGKGSVGVWSGLNGKDITIEKTITATGQQSKAIELNRKDNTLTLQDNITGMIDAGGGTNTLVLSSTPNTVHYIKGKVVGISSIENTHGQWTFDNEIELSAYSPLTSTSTKTPENTPDTNVDSGEYPLSHAGYTDPIIVPTMPFMGSFPQAYAGVLPVSTVPTAYQTGVDGKLIFKGKVTFDVDPVHKKASHITADHVDLKGGYQVNVTSLIANPGVEYTATLIDSSDIKNDSKDQVEYNNMDNGLWQITTNIDDTGLHTRVKASSTVDYKTSALDYNDDVTFGISNQVAKYRTDSIVAHGSNFLDFSMVKNTSGNYQNLSLLSTHLNVSTPLLIQNDSRNLINIQLGYYHGSGTKADFNRSVNSYTVGGGMKVYDIFKQKKKNFLGNLWLSTGFDVGISQQYNISRHNEHFNQDATKGKENDFFVTNTMLSGLDLYVHLKKKSPFKFSITPYAGLGFNLVRLGEYTETAVNDLKINSQYRLNIYDIFGIHAQATYKLKNSQLIGFGANIETNIRFNNKGHDRNYSYLNYNSGKPQDNTYKRLPITVSLDGSYQPMKYISIFTKLSYSTQEIYNYNVALGVKINF